MTHDPGISFLIGQNFVCPGFDWFTVSAPFNVWTIILRLWRTVLRLINVNMIN